MILLGDAAIVLKDFRDESIDCVVTSPPYWGLRDYGTDGQLGLESTFKEYIDKLVGIFDEIKRVLTKDGTCWVVMGDTYAGISINRNGLSSGTTSKRVSINQAAPSPDIFKTNLQDKSLCMIPSRFAIAMLNNGWILRNDLIWHKPNCMPSSATDRFTVDYEHIFFFTKSQRYYFKTQYEPYSESTLKEIGQEYNGKGQKEYESNKVQNPSDVKRRIIASLNNGRIKRAVWKIPTQPFPDSHFAVFPEQLIETPIISGCPEGGIVLDPFAGSGTTLKAAHLLRRRWVGVEINPDYVALIKKRLTPYVQQQRLEQFIDDCTH